MTYSDAIVTIRALWDTASARLSEKVRERAALPHDLVAKRAQLTREELDIEREVDALAAALDALTHCPEKAQ